jgi:hypothetical protein
MKIERTHAETDEKETIGMERIPTETEEKETMEIERAHAEKKSIGAEIINILITPLSVIQTHRKQQIQGGNPPILVQLRALDLTEKTR